MRRIGTALVLIVAVLAAVAMSGASNSSSGKKFNIAFDNAFGLTKGGDLRVGGVIAGKTNGFKVSKGPECQNVKTDGPPRTCAIVEAEVTKPGFKSFRADAHCAIRQQSLIGEYYVDCQPGNALRQLPDNGTIRVTSTESTVPADLVNNVMRRPYRERLRLILAELGTGLAGRPDDLAEVLRRAHPGLRETQKTLRILGNQSKIIQNFIKDSDTVVQQLDAKKHEVARWITETGRTNEISASRRDALAAGFHRLPVFLDELKPTMQRLGELTDQQTPLLSDLRRSAPALTEFFRRLGPFSQASLPSFRSLGKAGKAGTKAFIDSKQEIAELKALAVDAPKLGRPLRQFLQTADDKHRVDDNDPRAAQSAPPPPDRNSNAGGPRRGFTAMESVFNYVYWQTLAINQFDNVSHALRISLNFIADCSNPQNDLRGPDMGGSQAQADIRNKCNSYTGPYQPGVTALDPTDPDGGKKTGMTTSAKARSLKATKPRKPGERRGAGQPRALPLPGQSDISVPHVVLPPAVQSLIDKLRGGGKLPGKGKLPQVPNLPGLKGVQGAAPDQMLDFLLAP